MKKRFWALAAALLLCLTLPLLAMADEAGPSKISVAGAEISGLNPETNAAEIESNIVVKVDGVILEKGVDFTLTAVDYAENGYGVLTVTGIGNYEGENVKEYVYKAPAVLGDLSDAEVTLIGGGDDAVWTYTGEAIEPTVGVTLNDDTLIKDSDYTVSYADNVNAGRATVTLTACEGGRVTGEKSVFFKIGPASIANAIVTGLGEATNEAAIAENGFCVEVDDRTLEEGVDYTWEASDVPEEGAGYLGIFGKGNYTDSLEVTYPYQAPATATLGDLSDATVRLANIFGNDVWYWTGEAITPGASVWMGDTFLYQDSDYTVSYADNTDEGTASVLFTALPGGRVTGSTTAPFTIKKLNGDLGDPSNEVLLFDENWNQTAVWTYTGEQIKPRVMVEMDRTVTAQEGVEYTVSYGENILGVGTVTVRGTGETMMGVRVTGEKTVQFKILKDGECDHPEESRQYAQLDEHTHSVTCGICGTELPVEMHDFSTQKGTVPAGHVSADGAEYPYGGKTMECKCGAVNTVANQPDLGSEQVSIEPIPDQAYTGEALLPVPKLEYFTGDESVGEAGVPISGDHVTLEYSKNVDVGTAEIKITGDGTNVIGTVTQTFNITCVSAWRTADGKTYYHGPDGKPVTGWKQISGKWYYFDPQGVMQTGWKQISGKWYYLEANGVMATSWKQISGKWYYFESGGAMVTGWKQISGKWYYFESGGAMVTGWKQISGKWYYFESGGAMVTGWKQISGKWYYFESGGAMVTGWKQISGKWYYFESGGAMATGRKQISGKWYFFETNGVMQTGWKQVSGKWYYMESNGVMATGWKQISGKWYYFESGGPMATGWKQISGKWYYFESGGPMVAGWKQISGKWYYFESGGAMVTGWKQISGKWYYFEPNGAMVTGWKQIAGKWYYFVKNSGVMVTGDQRIDGKTERFDAYGVWQGTVSEHRI